MAGEGSHRRRIALVYPDVERAGGIERYVRELGRRLAEQHDVTVVSSGDAAPSGCRSMRVRSLGRPGFLAPFSFALAATKLLKKGGCDLVHVQGASAFRSDVVTAHSCHKAWFLHSLAGLKPLSRPWLLKFLNPVHYLTMLTEVIQYRPRRYKRVIAVSRSVRDDLTEHYGVPEERIDVVYNGVDQDDFPALPDAAAGAAAAGAAAADTRRRLGLREGATVALFVSNEFRRKGLDTAVRALRHVPQETGLRLLVVGAGRSEPYLELAQTIGVRDAITFTGPVADPAEYYRAADLLVLPTRYEPFGLVAPEAMASGIPVIVSRSAGVVELLEHGVNACLLDDPTDERELARALGDLSDPARRAAMGKGKVVESLSWERTVEGVLASYDYACGVLQHPG